MRRMAALEAWSPPPNMYARPPTLAAAASCRGEGSRPIVCADEWPTRTIPSVEVSAALSPPITRLRPPGSGAVAGSWIGAGSRPTLRNDNDRTVLPACFDVPAVDPEPGLL